MPPSVFIEGLPPFYRAWSNRTASAAVTRSNDSDGHGEAPLHAWAPMEWALDVSLPCLAHDILQMREAVSEANIFANPLDLPGDDTLLFALSLSLRDGVPTCQYILPHRHQSLRDSG